MKTAILLVDGVKQIMMTPETKNEKQALEFITADDDIHVVIKKGSFSDSSIDFVFGAEVYECHGGFYRAKESEVSVMFVLTPREPKERKHEI